MSFPLNPINNKYKTLICRHFESSQGCQVGDKCQYAHGLQELRNVEDPLPAHAHVHNFMQQVLKAPSLINYKAMNCWFYERDNYCKYGSGCHYAHGDQDMRSANDVCMLNTVATAINCQLNQNYVETGLNQNSIFANKQVTSSAPSYNYQNYEDQNYSGQQSYSNYDGYQYMGQSQEFAGANYNQGYGGEVNQPVIYQAYYDENGQIQYFATNLINQDQQQNFQNFQYSNNLVNESTELKNDSVNNTENGNKKVQIEICLNENKTVGNDNEIEKSHKDSILKTEESKINNPDVHEIHSKKLDVIEEKSDAPLQTENKNQLKVDSIKKKAKKSIKKNQSGEKKDKLQLDMIKKRRRIRKINKLNR